MRRESKGFAPGGVRGGTLAVVGVLLLTGCSALGVPGLGLLGRLASPPPSCPTEITASTDLSCEWWVDSRGDRPNYLVVPLPAHGPAARITRDQAIRIAHRHLDFEGEPAAIVHGQTDVTPGKPASAWVIVERYPNATPQPISGPCCEPHWATIDVAGVVISDQTGKYLMSWASGRSAPQPSSPSRSASDTASPTEPPSTTTASPSMPNPSPMASASPASEVPPARPPLARPMRATHPVPRIDTSRAAPHWHAAKGRVPNYVAFGSRGCL